MNIAEIRLLILKKFPQYGFKEKSFDLIEKHIEKMDGSLRLELEKYLTDDVLPSLEVLGYNVQKLMTEHGQNPIAAILTMDALLHNPEKTMDSLKRGHDNIIVENN